MSQKKTAEAGHKHQHKAEEQIRVAALQEHRHRAQGCRQVSDEEVEPGLELMWWEVVEQLIICEQTVRFQITT